MTVALALFLTSGSVAATAQVAPPQMAGAAAPLPPPDWSTLQVGDALPPLDVPLTASVIVAGAIASRDFMPVHHDRAYANEQGEPAGEAAIRAALAAATR